jgi:hypothetical protein
LANDAVGIFVLPSVTEGAAWELAWLIEHALHKTVFIVPPDYAVSRRASLLFWAHSTVALAQYAGIEVLKSEACKSSDGGIFLAQRDVNSVAGRRRVSFEATRLEDIREFEDKRKEINRALESCATEIESMLKDWRFWPFSSDGFFGAGNYLLEQKNSGESSATL